MLLSITGVRRQKYGETIKRKYYGQYNELSNLGNNDSNNCVFSGRVNTNT